MYNNCGQQNPTSATDEFIPTANQRQFQTHFWGAQNEGDRAVGQRPPIGGGNNVLDNRQTNFYQQTMGGVGPMKRAFQEHENVDGRREGTDEKEKENQQPMAKRMHLSVTESAETKRHNDGKFGEHGEKEEEEEEKEEEGEEGEGENSRTSKSSSSAENEEPLGCYSSSAGHPQQSHLSAHLMATPLQRTQHTSASIGNPLAHSTPYLGALSLNSFPQQPLDYWAGGVALHQQMSSHFSLMASNKNIAAGGAFVPGHAPLGQLTPSSSAYYSNPYGPQQHNLMAPFGEMTANGGKGVFSQRNQSFHPILQHNLSANSPFQSRDSGLGSVRAELKEEGRNETRSSTSGGSDESGSSGSAVGLNWLGVGEIKFPPFFHAIGNGQKIDLEGICYEKVPPRLALLNCNKKYTVTLAEIYRRLGWPEHLNTSYLSGILRKAKNTNAGKDLRDKLNSLGYGIDLRTGRRKQSSVTTFTTLCEREAIQMADDFAKLATESFPTEQIALEMNRRAAVNNPEEARQRMTDMKSTSQILQEAIRILQQGIENETLPIIPPNEATMLEPSADRTVLLHTTLNGVKNFARLSHCFGNRTVMVAWKTLLNVFEKCEETLGESLYEVGPMGGTSKLNEIQIGVQKSIG
ncbi:hypothetical protein niasHT_010339 [Heterodera trifolii]|uniref:Transcription factor AP-2 C-terminal domain-containing protein n=1 Tax=Heterodera trifolii TaxID=157864 RepID=A0ABD2M6R8_9BILA